MRYLVFGADIDNPQGGLSDLLMSCSDKDEAIGLAERYVEEDRACRWVEVYDTLDGKVVYEKG